MTRTKDDSDELLARAIKGDREALSQLFFRFRSRLRKGVVMRLDARLSGRVDPSDVVQEAYVDAVRRWDEYLASNKRLPLLLWFRLLVSQRLVDVQRQHLGAQMRDASIEVSLDHPGPIHVSSIWLAEQLVDKQESASSAAARAEVCREVHAALAAMDPIDREILAMRHFEQLSNQEIALLLGISPSAATNRYMRALKRVAKILTERKAEDSCRVNPMDSGDAERPPNT